MPGLRKREMKIKKLEAELLYNKDMHITIIASDGDFNAIHGLSQLSEEEIQKYDLRIEKKRKKRSLDANAYYFRLARECAAKMNISLTELHNRNLAHIGIAWTDKDDKKHWVLQIDDDFWLKQEKVHFCPTDKTEDRNGNVYRWFYLLKPSHLFDSKEMSRLIDYIVQDAKELGIETMTPSEIERIKGLWKSNGKV